MSPDPFRTVGEAGWRWVLDQVAYDDLGPWVPETPAGVADPAYRFGIHSGTGGLALALRDVLVARPWTDEESALAAAVGDQLAARAPTCDDATYFDGVTGDVHALIALGRSPEPALARLRELGSDDGWPRPGGPPTAAAGTPFLDLTLGAAGVLDAAVLGGHVALAARAADLLAVRAVDAPGGVAWPMVEDRLRLTPKRADLPNLSHGTAGVALALARAGMFLDRPDLVGLAVRGAEHLVTIRDRSTPGLAVPHLVAAPGVDLADVHDGEPLAWGWCHGPSGTSLLFAALAAAGVPAVAGRPPAAWHDDCLLAVRSSGVPDRLRPGFWDNDGRCCGTAGVAQVFLDAGDAAFAVRLGEALVERAIDLGDGRACWRFVEHRADDPLLPPGVGWMQGAAGIAALLLRLAAQPSRVSPPRPPG